MADLPGPPLEPTGIPSPNVVPPPPPTRPGGGRPSSPLTFGSRPLVLAIGVVLLATTFVAGVLGYRDHRDDRAPNTRTIGTTATPTTAPARTAPVPTKAATRCRKLGSIPKAAGKPTDIPVPTKPVTSLQTRDLKRGRGKAVVGGDKLTVHYVGISCTSGKQIDSSWDREEPSPFTLGAGDVIPGWDQGIKGMRAGGRRLLWIPASLAYGDQGRPPDIAPSDTLIFVIDVLKIG